jgi:hypothetical protein
MAWHVSHVLRKKSAAQHLPRRIKRGIDVIFNTIKQAVAVDGKTLKKTRVLQRRSRTFQRRLSTFIEGVKPAY